MRTVLGSVFKYVVGLADKVNAVNYLSKPPPPNDKYYYEEGSDAMNYQMGDLRRSAQGSNQENWHNSRGTKVETMIIINARVIMSDMGITTVI